MAAEPRSRRVAESRSRGVAEAWSRGVAESRSRRVAESRSRGVAESRSRGVAEGEAWKLSRYTRKSALQGAKGAKWCVGGDLMVVVGLMSELPVSAQLITQGPSRPRTTTVFAPFARVSCALSRIAV